MMVTFVSQCEKKALPKTRRVLDAFANRIGDRTWQTVITNEGLQAVKKLLRKTASKNTAVSCHWMRSRSRTELVWIVGNRNKFDAEGIVPVNSTRKTVINTQWEDDWQYLPLIKALTGLAALFHDWGKASEFFQWKLLEKGIIGDPIRHEWISLLSDGSLELKLPYPNPQELIMDFLKYGPEVEVLNPPELRQAILERLQQTPAQYQKNQDKLAI